MKFGIIGNTTKPAVSDVTGKLLSILRKRDTTFVIHDELAAWLSAQPNGPLLENDHVCNEHDLSSKCDILIALGGDGTMLSAARIIGMHGTPILGINVGKLGFLAEVSVDELQQCLDEILSGRYFIEERMVLQAKNQKDSKPYFGLNDIVVDKGASARVIDLETYVNGDYLVTYTADGIIVNTPTGSTAYSLASGGPIVTPHSNVITINPIAPHTLTARPVIVPDTSVIRITINGDAKSVHITADGQVEGFYDIPTEVIVQKAPYTIKLVKRKNRTYYDLLRTKLLWGRDVRIGRKK